MRVLILILATIALANACKITVYEQCEYAGKSTELTMGLYFKGAVADKGVPTIGSIKVDNGCRAKAYDEENFKGAKVTFTADLPCIDTYKGPDDSEARSLRDKLVSIKVDRNPCHIELHENCEHTGDKAVLSMGKYDKEALDHKFKHPIAAVKVSENCRATLYMTKNLEGKSVSITKDTCLNAVETRKGVVDWHHKPNSIEVKRPACSATVYVDPKFLGKSSTLTSRHRHYRLLEGVSSIKVDLGCKIKFWEHHFFQGETYTLNKDHEKLEDIKMQDETRNWNDRPKSAVVMGCQATLYEQCADESTKNPGQGKSARISVGEYKFKELDLPLKEVSAFALDPGCKLTLFSEDNFKGVNSTFHTGLQCLVGVTMDDNTKKDWNNQIHSLKLARS